MLEMIKVNDHGTPCHTAATIDSAAIGVVASSCQLGLVLQLLEEDGSWVAAHLHPPHLFLVDFLNGRVPEHGPELVDEVVPMRVAISWTGGIPIVSDPEVPPSCGSTNVWRV